MLCLPWAFRVSGPPPAHAMPCQNQNPGLSSRHHAAPSRLSNTHGRDAGVYVGHEAPPAVGSGGGGAGHLLVVDGELRRQDARHMHQM